MSARLEFVSTVTAAVLLLCATALGSTACGINASSSVVSIDTSGSYRWIIANGCPGYDWTKQTTPNTAYVQNYTVRLPATPTISATSTGVGIYKYKNGTVSSVAPKGAIGIAVNGVALFGNANALNADAYVDESDTFNLCNGHNDLNSRYHYHSEPGSGCVYNDSVAVKHSPLFGIMLDGIPIFGVYGDLGAIPTDLDECNGHTDVSYPFYHYHITYNLSYPYLINCLKGCVNFTSYSSDLDTTLVTKTCTASSTQYDYSSLDSVIAGTYTIPSSATAAPTTAAPTTTASPTTAAPTTAAPTTASPTTKTPTTRAPTVAAPTQGAPTTASPTTAAPTTAAPTTAVPTTATPTAAPTVTPTTTAAPTLVPTTAAPTTATPTAAPTVTPTTTAAPTLAPTTAAPTTAAPTTATPTAAPTVTPTTTAAPTLAPTTAAPTTAAPTTAAPTTATPTAAPTVTPTTTAAPTTATPTASPTVSPTTAAPTPAPTVEVTVSPTVAPTVSPTAAPTLAPSPDAQGSSSSSSNTGTIVGASAGAAIGIGALAGLYFFKASIYSFFQGAGAAKSAIPSGHSPL